MRSVCSSTPNVWRNIINIVLRCVLTLGTVATLVLAVPSLAQAPSSALPPASRSTDTTSHYLQVTINPSTADIIEGAVYGLDAELDNASDVAITVNLKTIRLTVQPELAPPNVSCTWFYRTVTQVDSLVMQPGDRFTVFFDIGSTASAGDLADSPGCESTFGGRVRRRLDFVPGKYAFVLTGTFAYNPVALATNSSPTVVAQASITTSQTAEHYFSESANLPVTIDQGQMILYAGLGGLLAFLVVSFRTPKPTKVHIFLRGVGSAVLLSTTVTVIAGRLSTTAFPVKVSIDDFWGAITIGFVSYFIGGKFIDKLSDTFIQGSLPAGEPNSAKPAEVTPPASSAPDATKPISSAEVIAAMPNPTKPPVATPSNPAALDATASTEDTFGFANGKTTSDAEK